MSLTNKAGIKYVVMANEQTIEGRSNPKHLYLRKFVGPNIHFTIFLTNAVMFDSIEEAEGSAEPLRDHYDIAVICVDRETLNHNDCTPIGAL